MNGHVALLAMCLLFSACGRKQAADPRDVLGGEMSYGGVDGRTGQPALPPRPQHEDANEPAGPEECRDAAEHLVALGIELAIQEEEDPQEKKKLAAARKESLNSEQARALSRQWTQECIDRGDTRGEVGCILKARREADLERCAPAL